MGKINVGVIGARRIGKLHTENLVNSVSDASVVAVADVMMNPELEQWAKDLGIENTYTDPDRIINDPSIEAVFICSSPNTHVDLMIKSAKAGKQIFCEKPIDVDIRRVHDGLDAVKEAGVKLQIGFVRRFDHNHKKVRDTVASGKLGRPHIVKITTRDAMPPPFEYAKVSGGLYMDMMIHDFDMARFLSGSEVAGVSAYGQVMMDQQLKEINDVDVATVMLKMENGTLCVIDNTRKSSFGYDQRTEVQCEDGCVQVYNDYPNTSMISTMEGTLMEKPLWFFLERLNDAYLAQVKAFIDDVKNDRTPSVGATDGLMSVIIAKAAKKSLDERRSVRIIEIEQ